MTSSVSFPLLENGLDYMESAVGHLSGSPTDRDLKYGVLHLAAAIEVLLKMRLAGEHWALIFEQSGSASMDKFTSGDFKSVGSKEALRRLRYIASVPVTRADEVRIDAVVDKRNRLQHYGLDDSVEGIQAVTAGALDFLLTFVDTQLRDPDAPPGDPVEETLNRIQVQVAGIKALVTTRMGSLTPGLGSHEVVLSCPTCTQPALILGEMCRCLFCLHESEPEQMAKEYVSNILRMSEYQTVKDGGLWPIHRCPACDNETLVEGVIDPLDSGHVNWHDRSPNYWVCFTDDRGWAYGEIDQCTRCGTPTETSDDRGVAICSDCYAYMCSPD